MTAPVLVTPARIISTGNGAVLHGMKVDDVGCQRVGEVYFSELARGEVRGWRRHHEMTLNIVVPRGAIRFVLLDERSGESSQSEYVLSRQDNYQRLTVPPMIWMAFQGVEEGVNTLCNIASIPHRTDEADNRPLDAFPFDWSTTN